MLIAFRAIKPAVPALASSAPRTAARGGHTDKANGGSGEDALFASRRRQRGLVRRDPGGDTLDTGPHALGLTLALAVLTLRVAEVRADLLEGRAEAREVAREGRELGLQLAGALLDLQALEPVQHRAEVGVERVRR